LCAFAVGVCSHADRCRAAPRWLLRARFRSTRSPLPTSHPSPTSALPLPHSMFCRVSPFRLLAFVRLVSFLLQRHCHFFFAHALRYVIRVIGFSPRPPAVHLIRSTSLKSKGTWDAPKMSDLTSDASTATPRSFRGPWSRRQHRSFHFSRATVKTSRRHDSHEYHDRQSRTATAIIRLDRTSENVSGMVAKSLAASQRDG
jgi:hypothetical protein